MADEISGEQPEFYVLVPLLPFPQDTKALLAISQIINEYGTAVLSTAVKQLENTLLNKFNIAAVYLRYSLCVIYLKLCILRTAESQPVLCYCHSI